MWDAVILTALLSMVVYRLVVLAEQRTTPWLPREADDLD
jgi:ABC-type nitrate/sulfonate/bicarbonate transport system permease component